MSLTTLHPSVICKLQRPAAALEVETQVRISSKNMSINVVKPLPGKHVEALFGPTELKVYARCWMEGTFLHVGRAVDKQDW